MPKTKFKFNPDKLTYEKYTISRTEWFLRILGIASLIILSTVLLYFILSKYVDTPKEKVLKRELEIYETNYKLLNKKASNLEKVISELEYRDENIYRVIFEADPIPSSIRNAGFGGIDEYQKLEGYNNSELIVETNKRIDRLTNKWYVLKKSYDDISKLAANKEDMLASIPAIQPVSNKDLTRIASGFGWRVHPIYKVRKFHDGFDFTAPKGTDIYATGDGKIIEIDYSRRGYGNKIVIDHGYGYKTLYAHLNEFKVKKGQMVKRGEIIGTVGNTGLSTGPHLHYEVIYKGTKINPVNFFHNDLSADEYEKVLKMAEQANQALD
jgi:murein DD-endopeptidase MepM/ murein hydrolase activator NlpD